MGGTRYLGLLDALGLHAEVMQRTGYAPAPLRSRELLEWALMRPQMAAHYEGADLARQCALLAVGVSWAQAWLDGNKRTAFAVADVFLRLNGHAFFGEPLEMARHLEGLANREGGLGEATDRFEAWLRAWIRPL